MLEARLRRRTRSRAAMEAASVPRHHKALRFEANLA